MSARKARAPATLESFSQQAQRSATKSTSPIDPSGRSSGGTQVQANESRPAVSARQVSYSQSADPTYTPAGTLSGQMPPLITPTSVPPVSDAPMLDIDWVGVSVLLHFDHLVGLD